MTHPVLALRAAVLERLKADAPLVALLGGPHIHDTPPRGAEPPCLTFGETTARAWPGAPGGLRHALTLVAWFRQSGDAEALAVLERCELALADLPPVLDGHRLVLLAMAGLDLPRHSGQGPRRAVLRLTALTEAAP
ncbi:MAG: DUF3168 domain-containing protein [Alsobacter sp.]